MTKSLLDTLSNADATEHAVAVTRAEAKGAETLSLDAVIQAVGPFAEKWIDGQAEAARRDADIREKELQEESSRNKIILVGFFMLACVLLIIAGIIAYQGRGAEALRLIETVAAIAAVAFGSYGWGRRQRRTGEPDR